MEALKKGEYDEEVSEQFKQFFFELEEYEKKITKFLCIRGEFAIIRTEYDEKRTKTERDHINFKEHCIKYEEIWREFQEISKVFKEKWDTIITREDM
jgi:hypothetical protein